MRKIAIIFAALLFTAGCAHKQVASTGGLANEVTPPAKAITPATGNGGPSGTATSSGSAGAAGQLKSVQAQAQDVFFDFDKYDLKPASKQALKALSAVLLKDQKLKVAIQGNCDERGTAEYNLALGDRRASAAKKYLEALGVSAARISTVSFGSEKPVCKEKTEACWAKNRRDHFVLSF
ncbi:MAG: peptidoglycan-associated lipoprotein Pal [Actinomycetota bacterium]|nr:peptidoglycan-associated lipoprotein Pal [Actinomycetota bacterium]